ncbi:hypothetical protein [Skermanella aerolata]|nr:hypothetical protein [Skermanella aerolata]
MDWSAQDLEQQFFWIDQKMKLGFNSKIVLAMTLLIMNCAPASSAKMTPSKEDSDKILEALGTFLPRALKCFHETGEYVDTKIDSINADKANGDSIDVIINFKGGLTGNNYKMTLRLRKKNNIMYADPIYDNALFPPSPTCKFRNGAE